MPTDWLQAKFGLNAVCRGALSQSTQDVQHWLPAISSGWVALGGVWFWVRNRTPQFWHQIYLSVTKFAMVIGQAQVCKGGVWTHTLKSLTQRHCQQNPPAPFFNNHHQNKSVWGYLCLQTALPPPLSWIGRRQWCLELCALILDSRFSFIQCPFSLEDITPDILVQWGKVLGKTSLGIRLKSSEQMAEWKLLHKWCPDRSSGSRETTYWFRPF